MSKRTTATDYLNERVLYGGLPATRGEVIRELQALGAAEFVIGTYMDRLPVVEAA